MDIDVMAKRAHENATAKGFHSVPVGDVARMIVTLGLELQDTCADVETVRKQPLSPRQVAGIAELVREMSDTQVELAAQAVLIATECMELFAAILKADWENAREELADIIIRSGDTFHELLKASSPIPVAIASSKQICHALGIGPKDNICMSEGATHLESGEQLTFLPMLALSSEVARKMKTNEERPYLHGKAR